MNRLAWCVYFGKVHHMQNRFGKKVYLLVRYRRAFCVDFKRTIYSTVGGVLEDTSVDHN